MRRESVGVKGFAEKEKLASFPNSTTLLFDQGTMREGRGEWTFFIAALRISQRLMTYSEWWKTVNREGLRNVP